MKTTFNKIKLENPCCQGWKKLIAYYQPTSLDEEVSIAEIIKSNGIKDALWALRAVDDRKKILLFSADVAESVLPAFEKEFPKDLRIKNCIQGVRDFANNLISLEDLKVLYAAARSAAWSARSSVDSAESAARSAVWSARSAVWSAVWSAESAVWSAAWSAAWSSVDSAESAAESARSAKYEEIETLLKKYCEKTT